MKLIIAIAACYLALALCYWALFAINPREEDHHDQDHR